MNAPVARLGWGTLGAYGSLALPLATIGLPLSIFLAPFYSGELGLPLAALGIAMVVARLSDVVIDPFIGILSDRVRTRWGRRRVWLPFGAAVMLIGVTQLFMPAAGADIVYFTIWVSVVYFGFTLIKLPYEAWGAELSNDYHERTRITSVRQLFTVAGLIAATALPALVLASEGAKSSDVLRILTYAMMVALPLCTVLVVWLVPEPPQGSAEAAVDLRKGIKILWRNGPFRLVSIALFLGYVAETFRITITVFFARDVVGVQNIGLIYLFYFITGFIAVPFWMWLGGKLGKHIAFACALGIVIVTNFGVFLLSYGQVLEFTMLFMAKGFCFGALELLPASMVADAADVDTVRSRERRQGLFFAIITMTNKMGQAIGQGLSLNILALVGYKAAGGNSESVLFQLKFFYGVFPAIFLGVAICLMLRYPLTAKRHRYFQAFLERRQARSVAAKA